MPTSNRPHSIGPYQPLKPLGEGGMGIVYRARHQETGQEVALKTLKVAKETFLRSLRREIGALANLHHPGIVRILDQGVTQQGVPWYAMELLEGKNLTEWRLSLVSSTSSSSVLTQNLTAPWISEEQPTLAQQASFSPTQQITQVKTSGNTLLSSGEQLYPPIEEEQLEALLAILFQLCSSLAYLHGEGILHRDLKPENVLVRSQGNTGFPQPVLLDFGLASLWGSGGEDSRERVPESTVERGVLGTVHYMSPEQIRKKPLDARSDLYALGVIFFELLCGQRPFGAETLEALLTAHLLTSPPTPSRLVPHLDSGFDTLVLSLLAKERQERPGYAEDVARTLASLGGKTFSSFLLPKPRAYLYRSRLVGREDLLQSLQNRVKRWRQGRGGLALLTGESGVGKTRLLTETTRYAVQQGMQVIFGGCENVPHETPLSAFQKTLQVLSDRCRSQEGEGALAKTERLLGVRGPVLAHYLPSLRYLPGQEKYATAVELPFEAARFRLFSYLKETLLALAKSRPLLLVLDDLQWADELSLAFLAFFLKTGKSSPITVLATYRSEESNEKIEQLKTHRNVDVFLVERLGEEQVVQLVGEMLAFPPYQVPASFGRFLQKQSEGNPFFVSEYLRVAVEQGLLARNSLGRWQITRAQADKEENYQQVGLSLSLHTLVQRWLSGLSPLARPWLEAAAILGRESRLEVLEQMGLFEEYWGLSELLTRQVLEERKPGYVRFRHDKLRESALEQISADQAPLLHRKAALALEQTKEEGEKAILGYHWEQAKEPDKAKTYYLQGARNALQRYSHQEAERLYRSYFSLVSSPSLTTVLAHNELGEKVLQSQGRMKEASEEHKQAYDQARQLQNKEAEGNSLRLLGVVSRRVSRYEEARELLEKALATLRETKEQSVEGITLVDLAILHQEQGRLEEARSLYQQGLAFFQTSNDRRNEGVTLGNMAGLYRTQGRYQEAQELYKKSLTFLQEVGDQRFEGLTLGNLAGIYQNQGRYQEAQVFHEKALLLHRLVGNRRSEGLTLGNLAVLYQNQGRYQEAQALYEQALSLLHEVGDRRIQSVHLGNLAGLYQEQGCYQEARASYEKSLALLKEVGDQLAEGSFLANLADLERRYQGNLKKGEKLCQQATSLLTQNPRERGLLLCIQGHLALAALKSAQSLLEHAKRLAHEVGAEPESDLGKRMARLEKAQQLFDKKKYSRLFRGEVFEEIPASVQRWLQENGQIPPQD